MAFKVTEKAFFVKTEVCGKNVRFLNISENTKENLINFLEILFLLSFLCILSVSGKGILILALRAKVQYEMRNQLLFTRACHLQFCSCQVLSICSSCCSYLMKSDVLFYSSIKNRHQAFLWKGFFFAMRVKSTKLYTLPGF